MGISDAADAAYMGSYDMSYTTADDTFADIHNLDHCIKYLNQSLITFGFPSALNLYSSEPASIVRTCNCIYSMIQQRQRDIEYRETANDTRQRLMSDMSRLEAKVERLTDQLASKERELQALTSKEQKAAAANRAQLARLQHEKDEFQRMVISTQQVRIQQMHELKKKEKDFIKLQERLNQVLLERKKEVKNSMDMLSSLQVDAYEAQKQELITENTDLRNMLRSMQGDMRDSLNVPGSLPRSSGGTRANGMFDLEPPQTALGECMIRVQDVIDLPVQMARDQLEQSLRAKMASIKECMMQLQGSKKGLQSTEN
ncbi:hypothetical protein CY35_07G093500 [Sphagnum magellanicum]|uniref:Uncharacterized protein n=1 Tax=Sphagnum magellanicum TaxID=128215 RepID=A0ACB8HMZ4_9BRYO|nr:hypothetical protein CY35_07G093500 [Sphagnum magellanicum]